MSITAGSKLSQNDQKPTQNVKHPPTPFVQQRQAQLKEEEIGVQVVQATTTFPDSEDTSLLPDLSNIDMMSLPIDIEEPEPEVNVEDLP